MKLGGAEIQHMLKICLGMAYCTPICTSLNLTGYSVLHGTALDTSLLIDHLGSYIFNDVDGPVIEQNLVMGISLGGHAAWQVFFNEPRVTAAVVIIGCPDYMRKYLYFSCGGPFACLSQSFKYPGVRCRPEELNGLDS